MADFEHRELEIGLEFGRLSFTNFSKGSSEPKKGAQVIRVRGRQPHEFFNSNYLFKPCENFLLYSIFLLKPTRGSLDSMCYVSI